MKERPLPQKPPMTKKEEEEHDDLLEEVKMGLIE